MIIKLDKKEISEKSPVFIVAELSANHNKDVKLAIETIYAAAEAGADAIKLQTYTPDTLTIDCDNEYFTIGKGSPWEGRNLFELYGEAYTPWEWLPELQAAASDAGITLFSTPFDKTSVDFLEQQLLLFQRGGQILLCCLMFNNLPA